jgi:RimJ/RimL family protein N-acetyltransferase
MLKPEPRIVVVGPRTAVVRVGTEADAARVLHLLRSVAAETDHLSREPDEVRMTVEEEAAFLRQRLESPTDLLLVVEVDDRIVASGSLDGSTLSRFGHATTLGMAVLREFWGLGVGRALLESLISWADSRGIVRIALEVLETNDRAIRLYELVGFETEGRLRAHRKHGQAYVDSFVMSRIRR